MQDGISFEERRSIVSIISTIVINIAYALVMLPRFPEVGDYSPQIFRFWGTYVLILIVVTVIAKIVISIVFNVISGMTTGDYDEELVDERERLIELKSSQISLYVFSVGFILAMAALVIDQPPSVMFAMIIATGILTEVTADMMQLYYYRWGI